MRSVAKADLYRKLPSVDEFAHSAELTPLVSEHGQSAVIEAARTVLGRLRDEITAGHLDSVGVELALCGLADAVERQLRQILNPSLRSVINATGVILHTNLGRAPLAANALQHIQATAGTYTNLEYDVSRGERGKRDVHAARLFSKILDEHVGTAAPGGPAGRSPATISTIVVNNNAAAVLLALNTLADSGEVVVSRGELVEIGGSFRIPEIMLKSGAILREVGTTNRTRLADYDRAINERTRLLLRVHRSNFQITGFTEQPGLEELGELARKKELPLMEDLGSGALFDLHSVGVTGEPGVVNSLRAGVHVVTYSGDKLLGGPQAGILSGRSDLIARMRENPLFRALRVDKLTYAALEATLLDYVTHNYEDVPVLRMMRLSREEIDARARAVAVSVRSGDISVHVIDGESVVGGGAAPSAVLPTRLLAITSKDQSADEVASRLRASDPPVIARVEEGRVLLDLRTVLPDQDPRVADAIVKVAGKRAQ